MKPRFANDLRGASKPAAFILFGGLLMIISFAYSKD